MEYTTDIYIEPKVILQKDIHLDVKFGEITKRFKPTSDMTLEEYHKIMIFAIACMYEKNYSGEHYIKENNLEKYFHDIEN